MANIRDLKKDINFVLGDIIDAVYMWEGMNAKKPTKESEGIIDDAISTFDELIAKVNDRNTPNRKKHLSVVRGELEEKASALVDRINALK